MEDYEYADEITCPYCGQQANDSWESPDSDNVICDNCGKEFFYERDITVKYNSRKIE